MIQLFVMVFLVMLLAEQDAQAYLDPGTGSLILQFLAGIALVVVLTVKTWWRQLTNFIGSLFGRSSKPTTDDDDDDLTPK
jgi:hypothetical protein